VGVAAGAAVVAVAATCVAVGGTRLVAVAAGTVAVGGTGVGVASPQALSVRSRTNSSPRRARR
jgi:hypothetical protein